MKSPGFKEAAVFTAAMFVSGVAVAQVAHSNSDADASADASASANAGAAAGAQAGSNSGGNIQQSNFNSTSPSHIRVTSAPDNTTIAAQSTSSCVVSGATGVSFMGGSLGHSGGQVDPICRAEEFLRISSEEMGRYSPQHRAEIEEGSMDVYRLLLAEIEGNLGHSRNAGQARADTVPQSAPASSQSETQPTPLTPAADPAPDPTMAQPMQASATAPTEPNPQLTIQARAVQNGSQNMVQ